MAVDESAHEPTPRHEYRPERTPTNEARAGLADGCDGHPHRCNLVEIRRGDEIILSREAGLDGLRYQQFWIFYVLVVVLAAATIVLFGVGHAG
jgi:hypothetical protein